MSITSLFKDFTFYGLIDVVQRTIGIVLIPYYTRRLTPEEFGDYDIFIVISSFLFVLIDFQIIAAFNRFYYEFKTTIKKQKLIGSVIIFRLILSFVLAVLFCLIGSLGFLESSYFPSFHSNKFNWFLIFLFPISTSFYDALIAQSRMSMNRLGFALPSLISVFFSSVIAISLIEFFDLGVTGILLALLLGKSIGGLISYIIQYKNITLIFDKNILKTILSYSFPLIPGWWLTFFSVYFARFFVYGQLGAEINAILAITMKSLLIVNIFTLSFRTAWHPIAMSYIGDDKSEKFYIVSNRIFILCLLIIMFSSTILIDLVVDLALPVSYQIISLIFPIFILASVISELEVNLQLGCQLAKKTSWISFGAVLYFVFSFFIIINFTQEYQLYAIGFSLLIPSFIKLLLTYFSSQFFWKINYSKDILFLFCLGVLFILFYTFLRFYNMLDLFLLKLLLFLIGLFLVFMCTKKSDYKKANKLLNSLN